MSVTLCRPLSFRSNTEDYVDQITSATGWNNSLLEDCKPEICSTTYGAGNSDIVGLGVSIGYMMANSMAIAFTLMYALTIWGGKNKQSSRNPLLGAIAASYYDCAALLCFAVQLASIVMLVQANFGRNAKEMGSITMDITWNASLLTLLPLLVCFVPGLCDESRRTEDNNQSAAMKDRRRSELRVYSFLICWFLSVYPFLSRMLETFPSKPIGNGPSDTITQEQLATLERLCFQGVTGLAGSHYTIIRAFGIGGWLWTTCFAVYVACEYAAESLPPHLRTQLFPAKRSLLPQTDSVRLRRANGVVLSASILFVISLFWVSGATWAFWSLRRYQEQFSNNVGIDYGDNKWTFGQIAAIAVFVPMLKDGWYAWRTKTIDPACDRSRSSMSSSGGSSTLIR